MNNSESYKQQMSEDSKWFFSWIIYYFQKSNRFVEQVIGNTDVDQGLSAGDKVSHILDDDDDVCAC